MAHVSHKLSNALQGALAGGGDPATSPLYIFGPFLKLIVVAGVAHITFGASVWLVVFTITMVSAMYRLVMTWVTDGSGGSGLSEEEFGGWAVKVNASITFIEYTLTFLVSMAALVTFLADRVPLLNETLLGLQYRTFVAIGLSLLTGWLVNRGPKMAAAVFGPATAAVLLLLWLLVFTTIWKLGFHLPTINWQAFTPPYVEFTFGGFARTLAVMTGIEVFANLVAAYEGTSAEKSRKAFGSLIIIMGTTAVTMLIVGPAIWQLSDPTNEHVSVFTQTMDQLLPPPLPYIGTLIGIAVLLSASAASAQGLQNLFVGLKYRRYVPAFMGQQNQFNVADKPVWLEVGLVILCFIAFGTREETYLAIYAAGVFILLSMTGWAAANRLIRQLRASFDLAHFAILIGTILAAVLTSGATFIIFAERFQEGAWTYFVLIPILYILFTYFRRELGDPTTVEERLGALIAAGGPLTLPWFGQWHQEKKSIQRILVPLDGSPLAEEALPMAETIARKVSAPISLFSALTPPRRAKTSPPQTQMAERTTYLSQIEKELRSRSVEAGYDISDGPPAETIHTTAQNKDADLIVMSTKGRSGVERLLIGSVASKVVQQTSKPVLLTRSHQPTASTYSFQKIMVPLDGSAFAERVLPYVKTVADCFGSEILFLTAPQAPEAEAQTVQLKMQHYLDAIATVFRESGDYKIKTLVVDTDPAAAILQTSQDEAVDLVMIATHGRSGLDRLLVGSVTDTIVRQVACPVFVVPINERQNLVN